MTTEQVETLKVVLFMALVPVELKHKDVIRNSIKYCVVIEPNGNLVTADWLNDYPEIKQAIQEKYEWAVKQLKLG